MATSAFKSTTKRTPIRGTGEDSGRSLRRSRSLSRFSRSIAPENEHERSVPDYIRTGPREKFVNTARGTAPFPEISLDDLAIEFFGSSSGNEVEESRGRAERKGREVGRWASDTASSRRRVRSVSRSRGDTVSSNSSVGAKNVDARNVGAASDASSRRRRSLSVAARNRISDSESEADHSRNSTSRANVKAPISGNKQSTLTPQSTASSNRRLGRTRSHIDLSVLHDGYSSHSSALTDDESKETRVGKNGFEKTIRAVYAQKKSEHPTEDVANGGFYEAMRKELRYAVQEIRSELNQAVGNQTALHSGDYLQPDNSKASRDFSGNRKNYDTKFEQMEKCKQDSIIELFLQEQHEHEVSKPVKELSSLGISAVAEPPSRPRRRSTDRNSTSKRLTKEAGRYFEDFISNVEDTTDMSSLDGERSDGSSTLNGSVKATIRRAETHTTPAGPTSRPVEMDGVNFPWLQWETSYEGSALGKKVGLTPVTPKTLKLEWEKDMVPIHDPSIHSRSSQGSWSPSPFHSHMEKKEDTSSTKNAGDKNVPCFDMEDYLKPSNSEELLFEMYRQRNRINSGGLLLCTSYLK